MEEELTRLHMSLVRAEKRVADAVAAVERINDELAEIRKSLLILRAQPFNPPRAEEVAAWRLPSGPVA